MFGPLASDSNLISAPDHPGKVNNKQIQDKNIEGTRALNCPLKSLLQSHNNSCVTITKKHYNSKLSMVGRCLCVKSISGHVLAKGAGQTSPLFNPAFPRHGQLDGGEASLSLSLFL